MHTPNKLRRTTTPLRALRWATATTLLFSLQAFAQTQEDPEDENKEPVKLNVFEVKSSRDYGYRATNAITATGSGATIGNTPMNIQVVTRDYLDDKGLNDIREAVRFTSSMLGTSKDEYEVYARGFESIIKVDGGEETRGAFSLENAERIEIIKGPVSVLQGRGSAGGVVNIISRKPKLYQETEFKGQYGSWNYRQGSISATGPIIDKKLAYLVGYSKLMKDGWIDNVFREQSSMQLGLLWRPTDKLQLTLDVQKIERYERNAQHLTMSHPAFLAMDLEAREQYDSKGLSRPANYPRIGESIRSWLNRTPGFGANEPAEVIDITEILYPRGYQANIQGPEQFRNNNSNKQVGELVWEIAPWMDFKSSFYHSESRLEFVDLSTFRANGGMVIRAGAFQQLQQLERNDSRSELVTRFALGGVRHRLLTGFQYRDFRTRALSMSGATINYDPINDGTRYLQREVRQNNPNGYPENRPFAKGSERSFYIVDQMETFNEHLYLLAGARWTERRESALKTDKITPQVGAVLRIPGYEGVGVYVSYGESFRPSFIVDANGNMLPPVEEKNIETGFKLDLWDDRVSGTITYFHLDQSNLPIRDFSQEAELGIRPIYLLSGLARSEGFEFDSVITVTKDYQIVASYSRLWEARTIQAEDVRQRGIRLAGAPESQLSFWNKYTFSSGKLSGLYFGGGARWSGEVRVHPSWSATIVAEPYWYLDALVGYKWVNAKRVGEISLRVENLLDEKYYDGTFRISEPLRAFVNLRYKF